MPHFLKLLCPLILLSSCAHTSETRFIVGVENQPYSPHYYYINGEMTGYGREILDAFADSKGYQFEYKPMPIDDLFQSLIARKIDFKYPDSPYWQHEIKEGVRIAYSDPVLPLIIDGVSVSQDKLGSGLWKLKILGIPAGFTPINYNHLAQAGKLKLVKRNSTQQLIELLLSEKIDGIYGNIDIVRNEFLSQFPNSKKIIVWDKELPYIVQPYMLSTAKRPRIIDEFNGFLKNNKALIDKLQEKYHIQKLDNAR